MYIFTVSCGCWYMWQEQVVLYLCQYTHGSYIQQIPWLQRCMILYIQLKRCHSLVLLFAVIIAFHTLQLMHFPSSCNMSDYGGVLKRLEYIYLYLPAKSANSHVNPSKGLIFTLGNELVAFWQLRLQIRIFSCFYLAIYLPYCTEIPFQQLALLVFSTFFKFLFKMLSNIGFIRLFSSYAHTSEGENPYSNQCSLKF